MTINLEQFRVTYLEECLELLADVEQHLMALESADDNREAVNSAFRCVHSIKGGAGAFGYNEIGKYAHELECVLGSVRVGALAVTPDLVDVLFKGCDMLQRMVDAAQAGDEVDVSDDCELLATLREVNKDLPSENAPVVAPVDAAGEALAFGERVVSVYEIKFIPHTEFFTEGNDPLLMIKALGCFGEMHVSPISERVPPIAEICPNYCYLAWDITLEASVSQDQIEDVFCFVDDVCDVTITLQDERTQSAPSAEDDLAAIASMQDMMGDLSFDDIDDDDADVFIDVTDDVTVNEVTPVAKAVSVPAKTEAPTKKTPAPAAGLRSDNIRAAANQSIRVDLNKIDNMMNIVGELVISQSILQMQMSRLTREKYKDVFQSMDDFLNYTRELQQAVMDVRMQPVVTVFSRLPRVVRDLSRELGKEVRIEIEGEYTEVDKTIIEQLNDPLMHMIRNALDHGLESPDEREKLGKPREGRILVSAANHSGHIEIRISDDGRGIDRTKVREKAISNVLIAEDDFLSDEEVDQLVFTPGFSTAQSVSSISGRGVGMDVVLSNIQSIGGNVVVENQPGIGLAVVIILPLTLAILDGMSVCCGEELYIIPMANMVETLHIRISDIITLATGTQLLDVRGEVITLLGLSELFGVPKIPEQEYCVVVIVKAGKEQFGVVVDELAGQQQVVIKNLEENIGDISGISSATILGDGQVALILNLLEIYEMGKKYLRRLQGTAPIGFADAGGIYD